MTVKSLLFRGLSLEKTPLRPYSSVLRMKITSGLFRTQIVLGLLAAFASAGLIACTTVQEMASQTISTAPPRNPCANIDWYEAGRSDGRLGYSLARLNEQRQRCDSTPNPVEVELYTNGRDAGLIEFCTSSGGFEAAKLGIIYERVCPEHLEKAFLTSYSIGLRVKELEGENAELEARIDNLTRLLSPSRIGGSVDTQIEQLKIRRSQNNQQIDSLENQATSTQL